MPSVLTTYSIVCRQRQPHSLYELTAKCLPSGENVASPDGASMRTGCPPSTSATKKPPSRMNATFFPPGERTSDETDGSSLNTNARPVPSGLIE